MSSIAGFTGKKETAILPMLNKLKHWLPDRQAGYTDSDVCLAALELFNSKQAHLTPQPFKFRHYIIIADCRIDNRVELALELGIENLDNIADVNYIALAYEKWGHQCVNYLYGDFAFIIWDTDKKRLFGARDHIGIKTLYYSLIDGEFVFSSEIKGIAAHPDFKSTPDINYFLLNLSLLENNITDTPYTTIHQIKNGCYFTWQNHQLSIEKYWEPGCRIMPVPNTIAEQTDKFNELLFEVINCRLRTDGKLGAEVSGGLDSTGIAAIAMEILGKGTPFYSYCYGQPEKKGPDHRPGDDVPIVEEFCSNYQIGKFLSVVNERDMPLTEYLNTMQNIYDDNEQNGVPTTGIAFLPKAKNSEVKVMLSGHGGDQVVTSRSYGFYKSNARNKKYAILWSSLRVRYNRRNTLLRFVYYAAITFNGKGFFNAQLKANKERIKLFNIKQSPAKQSGIFEKPSTYYNLNKHDNIWDKYVASLKSANLQMRAYHHDLIGKHYNIEYRFPLLDVRLMEYVMSLPRTTVAPGDKMRYLFSKAIERYVPKQVIDIQKSYVSTVPFLHAYHDEHRAEIERIFNKEFSNSTFSKYFGPVNLKK